MIACKTIIGYGAPTKAGTAATHGSPLGKDEIAGAREKLGWSYAPFDIPEPIFSAWRKVGARGKSARRKWVKRHAAMAEPDRAEFDRRIKGDIPAAVGEAIDAFKAKVAAEKPVVGDAQVEPGSARGHQPGAARHGRRLGRPHRLEQHQDRHAEGRSRAPTPPAATSITASASTRMAAAMNGMALHGGVIPYGGTFLVFTDYCRPSIRLAALMGLRVIYVMTHDSIGLGEDGPTHQPVEHLAALRAIPDLQVIRPADAIETAECWQLALEAEEHADASSR